MSIRTIRPAAIRPAAVRSSAVLGAIAIVGGLTATTAAAHETAVTGAPTAVAQADPATVVDETPAGTPVATPAETPPDDHHVDRDPDGDGLVDTEIVTVTTDGAVAAHVGIVLSDATALAYRATTATDGDGRVVVELAPGSYRVAAFGPWTTVGGLPDFTVVAGGCDCPAEITVAAWEETDEPSKDLRAGISPSWRTPSGLAIPWAASAWP